MNPSRGKLPRKLQDQLNKIQRLITTHHRRPRSCKISEKEADGIVAVVTERVDSLTNGVPDGLSEEEQRLVDDVQAFCLLFRFFTLLNGQTTYEIEGKEKEFFGPTEFVSDSIMQQALRGELPGQDEMRRSFDNGLMARREERRMQSLIAKLMRDGTDEARWLLVRVQAEHDECVRRLTEAREALKTAGPKGKANAQRRLDKVLEKFRKQQLKAAWERHNESVHGRVYTVHDPEYAAKCAHEVKLTEDPAYEAACKAGKVEGKTWVPKKCRARHIPTETLDFVRHGPISDIWKHWNSCVDAFQTAKEVHGEDASSKKIYGLARAKVDLVHELRKSGKMP